MFLIFFILYLYILLRKRLVNENQEINIMYLNTYILKLIFNEFWFIWLLLILKRIMMFMIIIGFMGCITYFSKRQLPLDDIPNYRFYMEKNINFVERKKKTPILFCLVCCIIPK